MSRSPRSVVETLGGRSRLRTALLTGGVAAGLLIVVSAFLDRSLLVETITMGISTTAFAYWFDLGEQS
jgi:hypothetical protein